jgi:hypothetical protein
MSNVHNRMPVILEAKDFQQWERGNVKDAAALMKPASEDVLHEPVGNSDPPLLMDLARRDYKSDARSFTGMLRPVR